MSSTQKRSAEDLQSDKSNKISKVSEEQVIDSALLSHESNSKIKIEKLNAERAAEDTSKKSDTTSKESDNLDDLRTKKTSMDYQTMLTKQAENEHNSEKTSASDPAPESNPSYTADSPAADPTNAATEVKSRSKKEDSSDAAAKPVKPVLSADDSQRQRKESHKVVEKKRRDNINRGINQLAALLPSAESNKSQILQRAVELIKRLQESATNNMEKWTFEKLLTDQAIAELSASNEKLKEELERTYRELEYIKKRFNDEKSEK